MADLSTCPPLTRASVVDAHARIRPFIHRTPVLTNRSIDALATITSDNGDDGSRRRVPLRLWFKCENLQRGGAFKARGAFNAIARLQEEPGFEASGASARGVVTHSSGNHAGALALAAATAGMPAHIVMPRGSAAPKVAATRAYGADIVFSGPTAAEREAAAAAVLERTGARLVPPYDHPDIILGQGTAGLELLAQVATAKAEARARSQDRLEIGLGDQPTAWLRAPVSKDASTGAPGSSLDAIITPCGGGGLLAGTVLAAEGTGVRVFGAEPQLDGADDCARGLAQGTRITAIPASRTIADGLRTPVGVHNWGVLAGQHGVDGVYGVDETAIRQALRLLLERLKVVVEPSAAVPLAVVLSNAEFRARVAAEAGLDGWDIGIILSGGNIALETASTLLGEGATESE